MYSILFRIKYSDTDLSKMIPNVSWQIKLYVYKLETFEQNSNK